MAAERQCDSCWYSYPSNGKDDSRLCEMDPGRPAVKSPGEPCDNYKSFAIVSALNNPANHAVAPPRPYPSSVMANVNRYFYRASLTEIAKILAIIEATGRIPGEGAGSSYHMDEKRIAQWVEWLRRVE